MDEKCISQKVWNRYHYNIMNKREQWKFKYVKSFLIFSIWDHNTCTCRTHTHFNTIGVRNGIPLHTNYGENVKAIKAIFFSMLNCKKIFDAQMHQVSSSSFYVM